MKVKDFAKALKTEPSVLLERMQSAGLSHKSESDEITPSDKQALLLFLKDRKSGPKKVVTTTDGDIKAKPKPSATKKTSSGKLTFKLIYKKFDSNLIFLDQNNYEYRFAFEDIDTCKLIPDFEKILRKENG